MVGCYLLWKPISTLNDIVMSFWAPEEMWQPKFIKLKYMGCFIILMCLCELYISCENIFMQTIFHSEFSSTFLILSDFLFVQIEKRSQRDVNCWCTQTHVNQ